ncbi:aromatic ring-opening dioxygenase LigA [Cellulomonas sp. P5_C5]
MTTTTTTGGSKAVRVLGLLTIIFGIIFIIAGGVTWGAVASNLAAEKITVSDDAQAFGGQLVDTPWEAWFQADIINTHALEASGGKTYAELDQDDPTRQTVMTASFLRASLFTSVVAFGVALLVVGIGVVFILIGWALRKAAVASGVVASPATSTGSAAYPDPVPAGRPTAPPAPTSSTTPPPAPTGPKA